MVHRQTALNRRNRSPWGEGWAQFRSFVAFLTVMSVLLAAGFWAMRGSIDRQLQDVIVSRANRALADSGWRMTCQSVELKSDGLMLVRGLQLHCDNFSQPALTVDVVGLHFPADFVNPESWSIRPDRIEMNEAVLKLDVEQWTNPAVGNLLAAICPIRQSLSDIVPVSIRNSTVRLFHPGSGRRGPVTLCDVDLNAAGGDLAGKPILQVDWQGSALDTGTLKSEVTIWRCERKFQLGLNFEAIQLNDRLIADFPQVKSVLGTELSEFSATATGQANLAGSLGPFNLESWDVQAGLSDGSLSHSAMRGRFSRISARLEANQESFRVMDLQADGDTGRLAGDVEFRVADSSWNGKLDWLDCRFDSSLIANWPPAIAKIIQELNPQGLVDLHLDLDGPQKKNLQCRMDIKQGGFELARFPYPISHCVGVVDLRGDHCRVDIQALESGQVVDIRGTADHLNSGPVFEFKFFCDGSLPINDKLVQALQRHPKTLRQVENLRPRGSFGFQGSFRKTRANEPARLEYDLLLKQCSLRHKMFEYPIRDIDGTVRVRGQEIFFENLAGRNNDSIIRGQGNYHPQNGLSLRFLADQLALSPDLRAAFQPATRQVWDALRPSGKVGMVRVDLHQAVEADRPELTVHLRLEPPDPNRPPEASIVPVAFPYRLERLRGEVLIDNGAITLSRIEGEHQRAWIACDGVGQYDWGDWSLQFNNVLVGSLKVDEDLLAAMPGGLQSACRSLEFEGLVNLSGSFKLLGNPGGEIVNHPTPNVQPVTFIDMNDATANSQLTIEWDTRVDMDAAKMKVGFAVENINGSVKLKGQSDGENVACAGQLNLDSISLFKMQVTNIQGPIWIDNQKIGAGYFASPDSKPARSSITGQFYDGQIQFDAQTWTDQEPRFYLQTSVTNSQLAPLAQIWAPQMESLTGMAQGVLRLWGSHDSIASYQGEGAVQLHEAHLFELPVFLAMLRQISRPDLDSRAFDSSLAQFTIRNEQILFDRMEFTGDALSLIGNGSLNFNGDVDLNFFTVMGRNQFYVPLLSELAHASSQQILWITVEGTLADPHTYRKILPGINEGLRRILGIQKRPIDLTK